MSIAQFPNPTSTPRKLYSAPLTTWDLNSGGLYSFKVVDADPNTGEINITKDHSGFTEFVLPVNPQAYQTSIPFSINVSATSGGVLEESNGVIFRQLSISGTFGVSARKAAVSSDNLTLTDLRGKAPQNNQFINGGSITSALVNTLGAAATTVRAAESIPGNLPPLVPGIAASDLSELGHKKINDLLNYLVAYAEVKKTVPGKNARLVFIDRKNGVNYGVSPQTFDTSKDANDPHVTRYRISLKAWDLASSTGLRGVTSTGFAGSPSSSDLTKAMNSLLAARSTVSAAQDVLRGVVADFDNMIGAVNSATLLIKGINGVAQSFADLDGPTGLVALKGNELKASLRNLVLQATGDPDLAAQLGLSDTISDPTNPSARPVVGGTNSSNFQNQQTRDFSNPLRTAEQRMKLVTYLDQISISSIPLTPAEQLIVNNALAKASQTSVGDLDAMRATFEAARDSFQDSLGLTDATVDAITGRVPGPKLRDPQPEDYLLIQQINNFIEVVDTLTTTRDLSGVRLVDPFLQAQTNANNPDITITSSTTGFPIPFPANSNLEALAKQYLGTPDRWIEIAVANGLQPPYVDEVGTTVLFLATGVGNSFLVPDPSFFFVGQEVTISSLNMPAVVRHVTGIRALASNTWQIQVDGDPTLGNYTLGQAAQVLGFAPNTVNSSKSIVIPTPGQPAGDAVPNTRAIPATANLNRQQKAMGVDLFLTPDFDIAIGPDGDFKLATGLANAIQAVKLSLSIEQGTLLRHPSKGLGLQLGTRIKSTDTIRSSIENSILSDDRFEAIQALTVNFNGDVITLNIQVKVAGGSTIIPLAFTLQ